MMTNQMSVFTNAVVDVDTDIVLSTGSTDTYREVSILLDNEHLTLEFHDAESLERLRDIAAEGATRLRAALEAGTA
jgi:hypothetical protein